MTHFKRRLLIGFGVCLVVLAGLGVWFYQVYFASTVSALQRAEAFLFRRMQVAQLNQQGDLAKLQTTMQQFMEEMRLKWAELAATETVNEDKKVVEMAKLEMQVGKEAVGLIERDEDRQRDSEERQRDRDAQAAQAQAKSNKGTSE